MMMIYLHKTKPFNRIQLYQAGYKCLKHIDRNISIRILESQFKFISFYNKNKLNLKYL